jgi:exportin-1
MDEKDEKRFLVTVIRDLLNMCDIKKGKENKAVVASNIMYVVGQYPRFLMAHWKFLKTVVHKLFEFMHETFPGVQEMACDTFLKISTQCKRKFVQTHNQEERPFIEDILTDLGSIISSLETSHIQVFYEAIGYMISCAESNKQEKLVLKFMDIPNRRWAEIMKNASQNVSFLQNNDIMRELVNLLKTNVSAAKTLGPCYIFQLKLIYRDMLQVYKVYSQMISSEVTKIGPKATSYSHVRGMRSVKKEALKLIEAFIVNADDVQIVSKHFMPPLFEAILGDYQSSVPDARNPQVLSILAISIKQLKDSLSSEIPKILENILESTLPMITKNFEDFPEHRILFFKLLQSINLFSFHSFFAIQEQGFKLVMNSILWAVKHTERNISETGLNMLKDFITNIETTSANEKFINSFYQNWYCLVSYFLIQLQDYYRRVLCFNGSISFVRISSSSKDFVSHVSNCW